MPAVNAAITRSALIERLMKEHPLDEDSSEPVPVGIEVFSPRRRSWNEFAIFVQDNLAEVEQKLSQIESQIWGKLIVMERNFRTAKAYLRNSTIVIDGGSDEFDGIKIGLSQFHNERRDPRTEMELKFFGKGVKIQLDSGGNLWMKRNSDRRISVKTRQRRDPIILGDEYRKIFDLRAFKESLVTALSGGGSSKHVNPKRLKEWALIFLRFGDTPNTSDFLEAPLWCCLIHLIGVDMVDVVAAEFGGSPPNSLRSSESNSCSTSTEESSASSSSYLPNPNSRQNKSGAARRIFQQRRPFQNHYQSPFSLEETTQKVATKLQKPRSRSQTRVIPRSSLPHPRPLEAASSINGWSLLNLSDIDKLRTPAYFASSEEAGTRRQRSRPFEEESTGFGAPRRPLKKDRHSKSKMAFGQPSPQGGASVADQPPPAGLTKYKWLSETCIRNAA